MGHTTSRKKRKRTKEPGAKQGMHGLALFAQSLTRLIPRSWDAILLTLVFLHVGLFLMYVAALVSARQPATDVLGGPSNVLNPPSKQREERTAKSIFSPISTSAYAGFTIALWIWLAAMRRFVAPRQLRATAMLLAPGTVMALAGTVIILLRR